ncbi:PQQ-binding-like beta-propeller repeat protein [Verrucomicrobiales bacterium BCK34]|nr:PQQ-binding-like beta-propeller repeat protein [Verrucomicrobiales bacterium BCK34]
MPVRLRGGTGFVPLLAGAVLRRGTKLVPASARAWSSRAIAVFVCCFCFAFSASAQDLTEEEFTQLSLKYRTAIHYDPLLQQPIDSLVKLYRDAKRVDELIGLYRSHVEQYPDDGGAKTALIRILRKVDRPGADELIASAVPLHPEYAPLQYLLYLFLSERGDERAAETLSRAIDLEVNPAKRRDWIEELLQIAESDTTRQLARVQLEKLLLADGKSVDALLGLARLMQRYEYHELSIVALTKAIELKPAPDAALDIEILLANAEYKLGNSAAAGKRLDAVLAKLAPDHWRRREIMSQRVNVLASPEEREAMLATAAARYQENPESEALIFDYAELLVASEKQAEAAKLLVDRSAVLSESSAIEIRALELLEEVNDTSLYKKYLETRLEQQPDRADLRFRLVKIHYAIGEDADAQQDFKSVVAGLEPDEISEKILELQRYLRRIDRIDAAGTYLERYLRNHPARLDVARELAEVYVKLKKPNEVNSLVGRVDAAAAEMENLIDFVEFLLAQGFPIGAKQILGEKIAIDASQFELGLLLIQAESEIGDRGAAQIQIDRVRELADSSARYSKWLETAMRASAKFEVVESFFDQEQARYSFSNGAWSPEKVERFMLLSEFGKQRLFTERVAAGIREQLAQSTLAADLRLRLKRFLVSVLEEEVTAVDEVIHLLTELKSEDPANELEYQLRTGMAYHRSLRLDFSEKILAEVDYTEVESADLLRETVPVLIEYGFHEEAERALETINRLQPSDVFSWEKRLGLLAANGREKIFRSVIRSLRGGDAGMKLRASTDVILRDHLLASYYRSMGELLHDGDAKKMEEMLPYLSLIDREDMEAGAKLWSFWSRAFILGELGRTADAAGARLQFEGELKQTGLKSVRFPDGLTLDGKAAFDLLEQSKVVDLASSGGDASFLLQQPELGWAFELEERQRIVRFAQSGDVVLIVDDISTVHAVDRISGKLLWEKSFSSGKPVEVADDSLWAVSGENPVIAAGEGTSGALQVRDVPSFHASADSFLMMRGDSLQCFESLSGDLKWSAIMPFAAPKHTGVPRKGSLPGTVFESNDLLTVVFRPETREAAGYDRNTGKLHWYRKLGEVPDKPDYEPVSLNSGIALDGGMAFLYGYGSEIIDVETGELIWSFQGDSEARFPITVREEKFKDESIPEAGVPVKVASISDEVVAEAAAMLPFPMFEEEELVPLDLLEKGTSMVSPSVYWSGVRLQNGKGSFAALSGGDLWLTQDGSVRRVSTSLPLISQELPSAGAFLGVIGNHAWFLRKNELIHADFLRKKSTRLAFEDLGKAMPLRAVVVGNQIVVRGGIGIKVVNGLTAQVIGQTLWEDSLQAYLKHVKAENTPLVSEESWRGRITQRKRNDLAILTSVEDLVSNGNYYTVFSQRSLICLRVPAPPAAEPAPVTTPGN